MADYSNIFVSYKAGTKKFYTIYTIGINYIEEQLLLAGIGFGHLSEINSKFSFQPEIIYHTYFPTDFRHIRETHSTHIKMGFVRNINDKLTFSLALSLYCTLKSNEGKYDDYGYKQSPIEPLYEHKTTNSNSKFELGFGLSLGLIIK